MAPSGTRRRSPSAGRPYRFGNWTWVAPWGWTWVDAAPWGYAPFHYGRWVWVSGRWGWCPGTRFARPVWAPALVGWYGGHGWATGGPPVYGWVPLGWGEPYLPSWSRCSGNCWRKLNEPYAVAQTDRRVVATPQRYANSTVPGAMTAVSAAVLTSARPVAPNQINVSTLPGATPPVLASAPNVTPLARQGVPRPTAAPVPASAQYRMLDRGNVRVATPQSLLRRSLRPSHPCSRPARARKRHRGAPRAPAVLTPGNGGRIVATPPRAGDSQVRCADAGNAVIDDTADVWWRARKSGRVHRRSADARSEGPGGGRSRHRGSRNRAGRCRTVAPVTAGVPATPRPQRLSRSRHGAPHDAAVAHPHGCRRDHPPRGWPQLTASAAGRAAGQNRKAGTRSGRALRPVNWPAGPGDCCYRS